MGWLITGLGRSGTLWLAEQLNTSKTWTVRHEPSGPDGLREPITKINDRMRPKEYIEITNYLLFAARKVDAKIAVVVRNPWRVAESFAGRTPSSWQRYYHTAEAAYSEMDYLLSARGAFLIDFHKVTSDLQQLKFVANCMGIDDMSHGKFEIKANHGKPKKLAPWQHKWVNRCAGWFWEKWKS